MREASLLCAFLPLVYHRKAADGHDRQDISDERRSYDSALSVTVEISRTITACSILSVPLMNQTRNESVLW